MAGTSALETAAIRLAGSTLSRFGRQGRALLVLIYHRVLSEPDPLLRGDPDAHSFAEQMDLLASAFDVLPLAEAVQRLQAGTLPARAVCITFDDGYGNNLTVAAPILRKRGLPATFFVATGYTGGGCMFNDAVIETVRHAPGTLDLEPMGLGRYVLSDVASRRAAIDELLGRLKYLDPDERKQQTERIGEVAGWKLPESLMMDQDQLRQLHRLGFEIGAHTVSHPILTRVDPDRALEEMIESRRALEAVTGAPVVGFAYPNGRPGKDYDASHVEMARRAGFEYAVSTAWGATTKRSDFFQIPRIAPWDRRMARFGARIAWAYAQRDFDRAVPG